MSIKVPIVVEYFGSKGIKKAIKEFNSLKTNGQKAAFALKTAFKAVAIGAAALGAAVAAAGFAMFNLAKAAAEDQTSQALLAKQLRTTTKATDAQITAVEKYIEQLQLANGIADSKLRPNFAKLVRATKSVTKAQQLLGLALDISAGSGQDLDTVTGALVKAQNGNFGSLTRLGVKLDKTTIKSKDFKKAQQELINQFGGAAATKADTFDGKMRRLSEVFSELKEKVGYVLLEPLTKLAEIGIAVGEAFGEKGAAGGIQVLKDKLATLFWDSKGNLNEAGQKLNEMLKLVDKLAKAGLIVGAAAIGGFALGPVGAVLAGAGAAGFVAGGGIPETPKLGNFNLGVRQQAFGEISRGPAGVMGPSNTTITVNVYNGDPREVVRALKKYQGINGKVPMRVLDLGT